MQLLLSATWGVTLFKSLLFLHGLILLSVIVFLTKQALLKQNVTQSRESNSPGKHPVSWLLICGLTAIGLFLRVWHLNSDLWYDEVVSLVLFVRPPIAEILRSFPSQNQHMFYSILGHISIEIFGETAWAVRLPAVLFGVAGLWAVYLLARRFLRQGQALTAFALLAVSYHHIWFSQNARGYTALMFFATIATLFFLKAISKNQWKDWLLYIVAVVLGMWSHMTMAFVVVAQCLVGIVYFTKKRKMKRDWIRPSLAFFLWITLTLQLYALALPEFFEVALHKGGLESEWTNPLWMIAESIRGLNIGLVGIPVMLAGGALVIAGWLNLFRQNSTAAVLMILPAILGGLTMVLLGHNLWPRFFFFSMGFGVIIIVSGAVALPRFLFMKIGGSLKLESISQKAGIVLSALVVVASLSTVPRCYSLPKQDFTGARDFVEENRSTNAQVVAVGLAGFAYKSYYAPHWFYGESEQSVAELLRSNQDVWLVYTLPIQLQAYNPDIWRLVQRDFKIVKDFPGTLGGGRIVVCRPRKDL